MTYETENDQYFDRFTANSDGHYGFVEPDGTVHFVDWGYHNGWAFDYSEKFFEEEFFAWRRGRSTVYDRARAADFLVYEKGWVLFHSPGCGLFSPTYDKLTRKQKETIVELYLDLRFEYGEAEVQERLDRFMDEVDY